MQPFRLPGMGGDAPPPKIAKKWPTVQAELPREAPHTIKKEFIPRFASMHGEQYGLLAKFSEHLPKRVCVLRAVPPP